MDRQAAIEELTAEGQPYELISVDLYGRPVRAFKNAPPTLRHLYSESLSECPFLVYEDESLSFSEVWHTASRTARILVEEYGIKHGDRVAISMRNYPEWILAFEAVTSIGAIAVAMNALWQPGEMAYGLEDSGARVLFADDERLERLSQCESLPESLEGILCVRTENLYGLQGARRLAEVLEAYPEGPMPEAEIHPNDDATIFYTSGSTGHPKGVVACHRNILSALLSWELDMRSDLLVKGQPPSESSSQAAILLGVPLFHVTGSHAVFLLSYRAQRRIVSMYKWDVAKAADLIEQEQINAVIAPAAMTGDLVDFARENDRDLSSLALVGGGGAPRAPSQVKGIDKTFKRAVPNTGWGMTETNAIGSGISGPDYLGRPESSGRASAVLDLRIVDEDGAELPSGERGELQVRGTSVVRGYWNRPDANAETFAEGWLRTGDVAYLDDEGFLFIVDRIKDLVIRGGENIGCGAVEAAILEHPDVIEASVYGVPDERLGEEVGATLYVDERLTQEELMSFLEPRLARFEIPRYVRFSEGPLPRIASGKILKRQLREEALAELQKA
ncbi:MAG: class I adenylate-forming enzyme family protein [Myxococcota bacterium]|nr:class I adenylate-forming enzyme family protein [Myxococcota bacterium]